MRNALISIAAAVAMFMLGILIIIAQTWFSARQDGLAGAAFAVKNINAIIEEAHQSTRTAILVTKKWCDIEGQYRLSTEAALQPHIRTILILKNDSLWCSSIAGNHALLANSAALPETPLLLVPAGGTVNGLPVLIYQTVNSGTRILISMSDIHIRAALDIPYKGVSYFLRVGSNILGVSGDVRILNEAKIHDLSVSSSSYPFNIEFSSPPIFSIKRLIKKAGWISFFFLLICFFIAYLLHKYLNRITLFEESLRKAIVRNEIVPFYQPIVNGKEGILRGVEVLARWNHPEVGNVSPNIFIPVAEKSGLIALLTQSLMIQVAENINTITSMLPEGFHIGINYSASHIVSPTFVDECLKYKDSFSRRDLKLVIEVTEREPLYIDKDLIQTLNILHEKGFAIALDDFGTGYSGLSYLYDLHVDYIKIDKSFVGRVNAHEDSTLILDAVLDLARKLSISIVAEGVETQFQLDYLTRNNITFLQGYYFFKPVTFNELKEILLSKPQSIAKVK